MPQELDPIILVPQYWEEIADRVTVASWWLKYVCVVAAVAGALAVGCSVWFSSWVLLTVGFLCGLLSIYSFHTLEISRLVVAFADQLSTSLRRAEYLTDLTAYPVPVPDEVLEGLLGRSAN